MININFPPLDKLINLSFIPLWDNRDRYLILYGSRASSKSDFIATLLVYRMLKDEYFKAIAVRETYESIGESSFKTICEVIDRYKLNNFFDITRSPFKIRCKNKNELLFRGLDKAEKLKGINNPNLIWWEEDIIDKEEDWVTISTTLRSNRAEYIQEIFTINPVIKDYESNWFWKMFFADEILLNFRKKFEFVNDSGENFVQYATIHHSTYKENKWLDDNAKAKIELLALSDAYLYKVYNLGIWANKDIDDNFYKSFDVAKNTGNFKYDCEKHLYIGVDFNLYPFSAITVMQLDGKHLYQIDEICVNDKKESSIRVACKEFCKKYKTHKYNVYIFGDATGKKEDASKEKGYNNYTLIEEELKEFNIHLNIPASNPSVIARGEFINRIFNDGYNGIKLTLNNNCKQTIMDFMYTKADYDGTIKKEMYKDKETGKSWEKYGHLSDSLTYACIRIFQSDFDSFKSGGNTFKPILVAKNNKHLW